MFNGNNGNGMYMPVAPAYGGGYGNGGFGFGGDGIWGGLLLGLLFGGLGGWGGFGGFGGGWGNMMGMDAALLAPYFTSVQTQGEIGRGFDTQNLGNQINAVQSSIDSLRTENQLTGIQSAVTNGFSDTALGIAGVNQNICQTGAGITAAVTNGFAQAEIADNARQIANMQQAFNTQTAVTGAINGVSSQLADCCCENRLATANLSALVQSENCADREALSNGIRDIIASQTAGTQRIIDQLYQDKIQDKIDAKNEKIVELQNQVNMQNLAASQAAQTAALVADNTAQTQYIVNRVAPYPIPAYPVPNPYGCNGYGFGFNNGFNNGFGFNPFGNVGFGNGSF